MYKRILFYVPCLIGALILLYIFSFGIHLGDPDHFYHFRISELLSKNLFNLSVPTFYWLTWDKGFEEKEFFFHFLTSNAFKVGSTNGVKYLSAFLSCVVVIGLLIRAVLLKPSLWLYSLASIFLFLSIEWIYRMALIRPHVLATILFFVFSEIIFNKKFKAIIPLTILFCLSYHGIYLLFIPLLSLFFVQFFVEGEESKEGLVRLFTLTIFGVIIGILLNPYFPSNVFLGLQHLKIIFGSLPISEDDFGNELVSLRSNVLFKSLFGVFASIFLAVFYFLKTVKKNSKQIIIGKYRLAQALILLIFAFLSPRAKDLLIPASFLALCSVPMPVGVKFRFLEILLLIVAIIFQRNNWNGMAAGILKHPYESERVQAVSAIPSQFSGFVLNTNWDLSPYLFYLKPNVKLLDILDPTYIYEKNLEAFNAKNKLNEGTVLEPYRLIKDYFGAKYVFTYTPDLNSQLNEDPDFTRLFPEPRDRKSYYNIYSTSVYRINDVQLGRPVSEYIIEQVNVTTDTENMTMLGKEFKSEYSDSNVKVDFIDLSFIIKSVKTKLKKENLEKVCAQIAVKAPSKDFGYALISGGAVIKLPSTIYGLAPYIGPQKRRAQRGTRQVLSLKNLKNSEYFKFEVCTNKITPLFSTSIRWLSQVDLENYCKKNYFNSFEYDENFKSPGMSCLGPMYPYKKDSKLTLEFM